PAMAAVLRTRASAPLVHRRLAQPRAFASAHRRCLLEQDAVGGGVADRALPRDRESTRAAGAGRARTLALSGDARGISPARSAEPAVAAHGERPGNRRGSAAWRIRLLRGLL